MRIIYILFVTFCITSMTNVSSAFDICEEAVNDPEQFGREMKDIAISRTPVKYIPLVHKIKLVTADPGEKLFPHAIQHQGTKLIVFPPLFAKIACKIVIAQFVSNMSTQDDTFYQSAKSAAKCFDEGGSQKACLVGFAGALVTRYGKVFDELPDEDKIGSFGFYKAALSQILMHEYAHHYLDHFTLIKTQKLTRIDSEFEADLFSVMNGMQSIDPVTTMAYIFLGLSDIEKHTKIFATPNYESALCRAINVGHISRHVGLMPMLLIDAGGGGGVMGRSSPSSIRSQAKVDLMSAPPEITEESCGRINMAALGDARVELKQLYSRMEKDLDYLYSKERDLDAVRTNRLLGDLVEMAKRFKYMDSVATTCIVRILQSWASKSSLAPLSVQIDLVLETTNGKDNFLSADIGSLLHLQGVNILQKRIDLTAQSRLDRSYSLLQLAVKYNPALMDAWGNLALIEFKRGNCAAAAKLTERAIETLADDEDPEQFRSFVKYMKELTLDPESCKADGEAFQLYAEF